MKTPPNKDTSTSLYRYFDSAGVLLYVGITKTGISRNRQHNSDKEWWQWVARQEVNHFATRVEAVERERALIHFHHPPFNKQHNPDYVAMAATYRAARAANWFHSGHLRKLKPGSTDIQLDVIESNPKTGDVVLRTRACDVYAARRLGPGPLKPAITTESNHCIGRCRALSCDGTYARITANIHRPWKIDGATLVFGAPNAKGLTIRRLVAAVAIRTESPIVATGVF